MWIVMTAAAHMPASCRGRYRKIAIVELREGAQDDPPTRIDSRDKRILQVIQMGNHHVGTSLRSAYIRALVDAEERCRRLNAENTFGPPELIA
jgi:hypothetical protein